MTLNSPCTCPPERGYTDSECVACHSASSIRAAQVRAIRWIAAHWRETYALNQHAREWSVELDKVADCIERGELAVPPEES